MTTSTPDGQPDFADTDTDTDDVAFDPAIHSIDQVFPYEDWQHEVANGDTCLGFREWQAHRAEAGA